VTGVGGAEKGTLTFMVGCEADKFAQIKALLESMGKNIVHCGPNGNGQVRARQRHWRRFL
jgi:3-hydroxyisobutyrate dehydrogenase